MLKITVIKSTPANLTLVLEGRLLGPWIDELQSSVLQSGLPPDRILLDLGDLRFADSIGVELLKTLESLGVRLENSSPFIHELIMSQSS